MPERVWQETERALARRDPQVFFETLRECGALAVIFPEIEALFGVPQPPRWHPEIDTGVHVLLALRSAAQAGGSNAVRFAALTHDLGKALTPRERWPSHHGHEEAGVALIEALCARLKVPGAPPRAGGAGRARAHARAPRARTQARHRARACSRAAMRCAVRSASRKLLQRVRGGCARAHRT